MKHKIPTHWTGNAPHNCEVCIKELTDVFIDGVTKNGPWAIMCEACFLELGKGLGPGTGQRYRKQPDGRWLKVTWVATI